MDQPIKKKRGRKPKENIITNPNPVFANDKDSIDDLIIKLNYDNNNDNNMINEISEISEVNNSSISEVCWNCCHNFDNFITGLPIKYTNNIFYTVGDFCSLECASRYAFENYDNIYEIINIINIYNNIKHNKNYKINMAPNKLVLKKFGGNVSINDYRNNNKLYNVNLPIIIHINNDISNYEFKNNHDKDLKLYRKKNNDKINIFDKMNLNIN
jgi:hypothetical protein